MIIHPPPPLHLRKMLRKEANIEEILSEKMFLVKSCFKAWYRKSVVKILLSLKSGAF